jgi:uncharacterized protein with HEPN domain
MLTEVERSALLRDMLAHVEDVLDALRPLAREVFLRDEALQFRIERAIVALGLSADHLVFQLRQRPWHPWLNRASRLRWGLLNGRSRLDWPFLWVAIPRDWPGLAAWLRAELEASG